MSDEINIETKSKNIKVFIIIAAVVIGLFTVGAVFLATSKSVTAKKVEKHLSLGAKYLSGLDYEQAIVAYELAIEIDPKNVEAYIGLADVYIAMGDYEKAEEVLEEAKDKITEGEDVKKIEKKQKYIEEKKEGEEGNIVPTVPATPTIEPTEAPISSVSTYKELKNVSVGEYITFGFYEQDNILSNGPEPIEWLVLDKQEGKALVLSKFALDEKPYDEEYADVTWENWTLRNWLNDEFYHSAFDEEEKLVIAETLVKNKDNGATGVQGEGDTKDKVFLLSIEEVTTYFDSDQGAHDPNRRAKVTEYAKAQGGWYSTSEDYYGNGWWLLRSPGIFGSNAAGISEYGNVTLLATIYGHSNVVRPALWITYSNQELTPTPISEPTVPTSTSEAQSLKNALVGDSIYFGTYEQDNDLSNGAEAIEWLVLDKKDGKALILSKYGLDAKPYNLNRDFETWETWETCTLRSWLNDEFFRTAFNSEERSVVVESLVKNDDNPDWGTEGGNDTEDKVFLLSIEEVTTYFDLDVARRVKITEYAKAQGGWHYDDKDSEDYGNGKWWLRSLGWSYSYAGGVNYNGSVDCFGNFVVSLSNVVRPALWITYSDQEAESTQTSESMMTPSLDSKQLVQVREVKPYTDGKNFVRSGGEVIITRKNGLYGAVNEAGEEVVANEYTSYRLEPNAEGWFALGKEGGVYCFDSKGNVIYEIEKDLYVLFISEGYISYVYYENDENDRKTTKLGVYDIVQGELLPIEQPSINVEEITPVMNGKIYVTWAWLDTTRVDIIDVKTLEKKTINSDWWCEFLTPQGDYGATVAHCVGNNWLGLMSTDGSAEYNADVLEIIDMYAIPSRQGYEYAVRAYWDNGKVYFNYEKQIVIKITSNEDGSEHYFLLDFANAEIEYRSIEHDSGVLMKQQVVSNLKDVILAKYDYINLSPNGYYLAAQGDDWFYIDSEGRKVADYVDCSDYVGQYALALEEDGMAYLIDTNFNKVSEGYPADAVYATGSALGVENEGQVTLLFVSR